MAEIEARLKSCPRLPSLRSIDSALRELVHADTRYTHQIADIVRRDPSLTARLLRLVNSVYYALKTPAQSIEEAVFYLGVRQIRQLVMVTPVIEDFQKLAARSEFPWRPFWQHCIGTAILTRELLTSSQSPAAEMDYVAGLLHDVGKIAMAAAFPNHFDAIYARGAGSSQLLQTERELLGIDHAELGARYLQQHQLPSILICAARYHHSPLQASEHQHLVAAVEVANLLARFGGIGLSGDTEEVADNAWLESDGWHVLFPEGSEQAGDITIANLRRTLDRLPSLLDGMV
jgi:putative nucleotidyltransferase with HDIG domain